MRVQAAQVQEWLRTSLAVVPMSTAVAAFVLAKLLVSVDQHISQTAEAWWLFEGGSGSAELFLSIVASSLMQFTAVVFSITILVLQLASSQFSPRVLRTFLEDRNTQWTMGVFIGSFVY